jgi:hypothetical protein
MEFSTPLVFPQNPKGFVPLYGLFKKLKSSTLVPCGVFLHGAHPGYLRQDDAEA